MLAQTVYGVVPNENGYYVMVSLHSGKRHSRITIHRWNTGDKLQPVRLLYRGVYCGVPSFWKSPQFQTSQDILTASGVKYHRRRRWLDFCGWKLHKSRRHLYLDEPSCSTAEGSDFRKQEMEECFVPWTDRISATIHVESFSNNLLALIPDDSYLCTIPLQYGNPSLHSFICVHAVPASEERKAYYKIGIILNTAIIAVFTMSPGTIDALEFHLGRIRRFFARMHRLIDFPEHVYLFGIDDNCSSEHFIFHPLSVKIGEQTLSAHDELKALGCALAQRLGKVPIFSGPSKASASRYLRSAAWITSAAILLMTACAVCTPLLMNVLLNRELRSYEAQYRSMIINNPAIQALIARNDSLGTSIIRMSAKSSQRTPWGRFLHALGSMRPMGLYYDKLGSEVAGSSSNAVRIAISGFAQNETMVTDLISRLQKTSLISNIALTSIEKNKTKKDICDFKIICTLKITGL